RSRRNGRNPAPAVQPPMGARPASEVTPRAVMCRGYDRGMKSMLRTVAVVALGMFAGCATAPPPSNVGAAIAAIEPAKGIAAIAAPTGAGAEAPRSVLLVSVDGLGAEMLSPDVAPRITAMAASGVRAEWMNPSYPVLTFPNHYTLVTGLRPDRHGVVHNKMEDPALGRFENRLSADL